MSDHLRDRRIIETCLLLLNEKALIPYNIELPTSPRPFWSYTYFANHLNHLDAGIQNWCGPEAFTGKKTLIKIALLVMFIQTIDSVRRKQEKKEKKE
ncbi:12125_t:CDS:2, partial [Gigaspora rosea]